MHTRSFNTQLLKWVGNKQRMASEIVSFFPSSMGTYFEPFLGSGAVLATLSPDRAIGSDVLPPLIGIFQLLMDDPDSLIAAYDRYRSRIDNGEDKRDVYRDALESFNLRPNPEDFVFLTRACYGGVIRFRSTDKAMSTPVGSHTPISTDSFRSRVHIWRARLAGSQFWTADFRTVMPQAVEGDFIYCDPPYVDSQKILYGAQAFNLADLISEIASAKARGVKVALSLDGSKRGGLKNILHEFPVDLFETEVAIDVGRSMLLRFQREGRDLVGEEVSDRLLLTYVPG